MVTKNTSKKSWCLLNVPPLPEGPVKGGNSPLPHLPLTTNLGLTCSF